MSKEIDRTTGRKIDGWDEREHIVERDDGSYSKRTYINQWIGTKTLATEKGRK